MNVVQYIDQEADMKKKLLISTCCAVMLLPVMACTHQEAAMVGTMIGRPIGYPLGVGAVAISEVFGTASDINKASYRNNKYSSQVSNAPVSQPSYTPTPTRSSNGSYYYETKVVIKTQAPTTIEDIYFKDSKDVTNFWN